MNPERAGFPTPRKGFVFPLVLFVAFSVSFFAFIVSNLNRGYRGQVMHSDERQKTFQIAQAAYSKTAAVLAGKPWAKRNFRQRPHMEFGVPVSGGEYDCFVENSPGKFFQADVYVRARFERQSQVYFWRITYQDDVLDLSRRVCPVLFAASEDDDLPSENSRGFAAVVETKLAERKANEPIAQERAVAISSVKSVQEVAQIISARSPDAQPIIDPESQGIIDTNQGTDPEGRTGTSRGIATDSESPTSDPSKSGTQASTDIGIPAGEIPKISWPVSPYSGKSGFKNKDFGVKGDTRSSGGDAWVSDPDGGNSEIDPGSDPGAWEDAGVSFEDPYSNPYGDPYGDPTSSDYSGIAGEDIGSEGDQSGDDTGYGDDSATDDDTSAGDDSTGDDSLSGDDTGDDTADDSGDDSLSGDDTTGDDSVSDDSQTDDDTGYGDDDTSGDDSTGDDSLSGDDSTDVSGDDSGYTGDDQGSGSDATSEE